MCIDPGLVLDGQIHSYTRKWSDQTNLKVVDGFNGVNTPNPGVAKPEQKFLIIFISVSQILTYQQELRLYSPEYKYL